MFALGCIQALRCNTNKCPVGITTQNPRLVAGLVVPDKVHRVANFHRATVRSLLELLSAAGLQHPSELEATHISRQMSKSEVRTYDKIYPFIAQNSLLSRELPPAYAEDWQAARRSAILILCSPLAWIADRENRAAGETNHTLCHRTEHGPAPPCATMGGNDHEVLPLIMRKSDDFVGGIAMQHDQ